MNIEIERRDCVRVVMINRPDARNAVNSETSEQPLNAFAIFDADTESDVAVLTGRTVRARFLLLKPVIAAVEGGAVAVGLETGALV